MNRFRVFAIVALLLVVRTASGDDASIRIDNSRSPNGKLELWIMPIKDTGEAAGTAQVRSVGNGRILGAFDWSGFGEEADSKAFKVIWRGDNHFFAISYELSRGYMSGAIYGSITRGHWIEVKLPTDDYVKRIKKMSGVEELKSGKGWETPKSWLPNGDLELEFGSEDIMFNDVDAMKDFVVTLKVADEKGQPLKIAKVMSIREKTEEQVEEDLYSE